MKKFKLILFIIATLFGIGFSIAAFSQTTIIGNNQCISPYNGAQKITIQRINIPAGEWVEADAPANIVTTFINGIEITTQVIGWAQATSTGIVAWDFNASTSDPIVSATISNGWVLPAGTYQITTKLFSDKTGISIQAVPFQIVGTATVAILTAIKNRGKKNK